jgi:hypothetical protein
LEQRRRLLMLLRVTGKAALIADVVNLSGIPLPSQTARNVASPLFPSNQKPKQ